MFVFTDSKALLIGPGYGSDGKSEVLSLPDLTPINCTIPIIPERNAFGERMYDGYVGRYTSDGVHICGGEFNGVSNSSCYMVTKKGYKEMPGMLNKRYFSASVMTPLGWWVTGIPPLALSVIDLQLILTGGKSFYLRPAYATTELWSNNQWQEHVRLPVRMNNHCMTWVNQSHILLTGGYTEEGDYSAASYLYSEETGFTRIEDMKTPRTKHGCSVINDSLVFVAGGFSKWEKRTEYLDLATLTWFAGPELPGFVSSARMTGDILVGGKKKIFKLETWGQSSVGQWQWVEVGELKDSRNDFQTFVISEKYCN